MRCKDFRNGSRPYGMPPAWQDLSARHLGMYFYAIGQVNRVGQPVPCSGAKDRAPTTLLLTGTGIFAYGPKS